MRHSNKIVALLIWLVSCTSLLAQTISDTPGSGGGGTVTSVSVTTANGVSGTVANPTTTPAISLTLGAITPSSVAIGAGSAITSSGPGGALGSNAFTSTVYLPLTAGSGNPLTGDLYQSTNGAASAPALYAYGTWFTGGSGTTTKPYMLIEPTGTTSTAWQTNGTAFGINANSAYTGYFVDFQVNAVSRFGIDVGSGLVRSSWPYFVNTLVMVGSSGLAVNAASNTTIGFVSGTNVAITPDTNFGRMGVAGTIGLTDNSSLTTATTLQVYGTSDVAFGTPTNYERLSLTKVVGGAAVIDVQHGGTGVASTKFAIRLDGTAIWDYGSTTSGHTTINSFLDLTNQLNAVIAINLQTGPGTLIGGSFFFSSDGVLRLSNYGVTDFGRIQFGGTTSSFPALGRSGTSLQVRLADNSADASLTALNITASGQLNVTAMTQTSAAQSGTVCYNSGTGAVTYDATLGCLTSTMRAKDNWHVIPDDEALAKVVKMIPGSYTYKPGLGLPSDEQIGIAAEQMEGVDTRLVAYDDKGQVRGTRYQQASALYPAAIRKLQSEIEELRRKLH